MRISKSQLRKMIHERAEPVWIDDLLPPEFEKRLKNLLKRASKKILQSPSFGPNDAKEYFNAIAEEAVKDALAEGSSSREY